MNAEWGIRWRGKGVKGHHAEADVTVFANVCINRGSNSGSGAACGRLCVPTICSRAAENFWNVWSACLIFQCLTG